MRSIFTLVPFLLAAQAVTPPETYTIHHWAGTAWTADGRAATAAVLIQPSGLATDPAGNLYIADARDHRVRMVSRDGVIRTVAGTGVAGLRGDGEPATASPLHAPYGVAIDWFGNLYIADLGNALVRRVGFDGRMVTVAGGGTQPPATVGARATTVKLNQPRDVAVDRMGNVFIADFGAHQIYQVTPDGTLVTIAGTGQPGAIRGPTLAAAAPLTSPAGLAIDSYGALYIADSGGRRVRRLTGGWLSTVTDKAGKEIEFGTPTGIAVDSGNRIYVADGSARTTVVWQSGDFLSLGIGGSAVALGPNSEVFTIADRQVVRLTGGSTTVVAGNTSGPGAGDGFNRAEWRFQSPSSLARDSAGTVYVADTGTGRVRRITAAGELSTVTTKLSSPTAVALDAQSRLYMGDKSTSAIYRLDASGQARVFVRSEGRAMNVDAMAFDREGSLYFTDSANHVIRRVSPEGAMTVVAGGGTQPGDGIGLLAKLELPSGLAVVDDGALWFTEAGAGRIRRFQHGRLTTLAGPPLKEPRSLRLDGAGNLVVCDAALHRVLRIAPDGTWTPMAGTGDKGHSGDGELALSGMLDTPVDTALDSDGTMLVLDSGNHRIRLLKPQAPASPVVVPPPEELKMPVVDVIHMATRQIQAVAPGQLALVAGENLNGASVIFGSVSVVPIATGDEGLTVQVPLSLKPGVVEVSASRGTEILGKAAVDIAAVSPGILTSSGGRGQAMALNEDGRPNGFAHPAARMSVVSLFLTGEGGGYPSLAVEIGGAPADVAWSGPAPTMPGVYQINVRMPGGFTPSGVLPVVISVDGVATQPGVTLVSR